MTCLGSMPVVDGPGGFLPDLPANLRNAGDYNKVPELIMHTSEEGHILSLYGQYRVCRLVCNSVHDRYHNLARSVLGTDRHCTIFWGLEGPPQIVWELG